MIFVFRRHNITSKLNQISDLGNGLFKQQQFSINAIKEYVIILNCTCILAPGLVNWIFSSFLLSYWHHYLFSLFFPIYMEEIYCNFNISLNFIIFKYSTTYYCFLLLQIQLPPS